MQALDTLAEEHETLEETVKKVTHETEQRDMLFAVACEVGEELARAQKDQDRLEEERANVNNTSIKLNGAFSEVSNC